MGPRLASAWAARRLRQGTDGTATYRPAGRSPAAAIVDCGSQSAATSIECLPSGWTKPEIIAEQEAARGLEQELIHALVICLTANDAHRGLTATSCGNHGPLRGRIDSACWPTDEHGRVLRRRRCAAAVAGMLRGVLGHEPQPVSSAATTEPGTCGPAASRSHDGKCREDC